MEEQVKDVLSEVVMRSLDWASGALDSRIQRDWLKSSLLAQRFYNPIFYQRAIPSIPMDLPILINR